MNILNVMCLWFLNCAVVSCLLFWWFASTLPVLATQLARLVLNRPDAAWQFPNQMACEPMRTWSRSDWEKWRLQTLMPEYPKFAHMLGCSRCISFHMSYATAIVLLALGTQDWPILMRLLFFFAASFGSSTTAHRLIPGTTSWSQK